jgi:hypothetical protein
MGDLGTYEGPRLDSDESRPTLESESGELSVMPRSQEISQYTLRADSRHGRHGKHGLRTIGSIRAVSRLA